jgi:WhiB family transcriptional regulator, redox-sensing transcriptional regulator
MTALAERPTLDLRWLVDGPTDEMIATHGWRPFGACFDVDPDRMFPDDEAPDEERIAQELDAMSVCARCPLKIRGICREESIDEPYGIFAGKTAEDRARAKNAARQRKRRQGLRTAA